MARSGGSSFSRFSFSFFYFLRCVCPPSFRHGFALHAMQSLRGMALVEEELMTDLTCMDYTRVCKLLALYGGSYFLLFDIIKLADYCGAKKVHLIYDKREHPRQSLLQRNLGTFLLVFQCTSLSLTPVSRYTDLACGPIPSYKWNSLLRPKRSSLLWRFHVPISDLFHPGFTLRLMSSKMMLGDCLCPYCVSNYRPLHQYSFS